MDLEHHHPTPVDIVRACYNDDATDLLAVAAEHSVDILIIVRVFTLPLSSLTVVSVRLGLQNSSVLPYRRSYNCSGVVTADCIPYS